MLGNLTRDNIEPAAACFVDIFQNQPFEYFWMRKDDIIRYFEDMYACPNFTGFSLTHEGAIRGFCFGLVNDYFNNDFYEIKEIFVERCFQGKGLGTVFLQEVESVLRKRGISCVSLLTDKAIPAYSFYCKNGYESFAYSIFMSKNLI